MNSYYLFPGSKGLLNQVSFSSGAVKSLRG